MEAGSRSIFLALVRLGIKHRAGILPESVDWTSIQGLAEKHGLSAVVLDGLDVLRTNESHNANNNLPDKQSLTQWIGKVLQGYEYRYELYCRAIAEMANFYNGHGYKMMVLKGYACSLNWPKPEYRPCGDIDIWMFGKQKEADAALVSSSSHSEAAKPSASFRAIKIDSSHHHHTVFSWGEFTVENHYDFVNVHAHRSSAELEKVFKELGKDNSNYVEVKCNSTGLATKIYLPSPNLHALFLIKHMISHFAAAEITLRQVLDWAFFVEKHTKEIDWDWLNGMLEHYHMKDFVNCLNAICVEDLGFEAEIFQGVQFSPQLKEKILSDILNPEFVAAEPKFLIPRLMYKYKRWNGNAWKQKLCYNESRWEYFWSGVWAKLLKPASI